MEIIKLNQIKKIYKNGKVSHLAVDDISLSIHKGEIVGLVGPNGAGKSTIVKLLCGILTPTAGTIEILDMEPHKNRKLLAYQLGVMFGNRSSLWYNLPAIETVLLMKSIYNIKSDVFAKRLDKYSSILEVTDILNKPVRQMSQGQKIRVELLVTLLHNPTIIILDEPTLGLDIVAKLQFREMLRELAKENETTVVLTTHDLGDVEKICHRVVLINKGKKLIDLAQTDFERGFDDYEVIFVNNNTKYNFTNYKFFREKNEQWYKFLVPLGEKKSFVNDIMAYSNYELQIKIEKPNLEDILYEYYR